MTCDSVWLVLIVCFGFSAHLLFVVSHNNLWSDNISKQMAKTKSVKRTRSAMTWRFINWQKMYLQLFNNPVKVQQSGGSSFSNVNMISLGCGLLVGLKTRRFKTNVPWFSRVFDLLDYPKKMFYTCLILQYNMTGTLTDWSSTPITTHECCQILTGSRCLLISEYGQKTTGTCFQRENPSMATYTEE